jgi:hypothetical protein
MYKLESISKERWIYISGEDSFYESDEFVALVKEYRSQIGGELIAVSDDIQYKIVNDPLKLIFQWDSCFGIAVVVPHQTDIAAAEKAMRYLCDSLNNKHTEQKKS